MARKFSKGYIYYDCELFELMMPSIINVSSYSFRRVLQPFLILKLWDCFRLYIGEMYIKFRIFVFGKNEI